jgi:hypothetical protein
MAAFDAIGIFLTGAYYTQVHPQVVENPQAKLASFDWTTSHDRQSKIDLTLQIP